MISWMLMQCLWSAVVLASGLFHRVFLRRKAPPASITSASSRFAWIMPKDGFDLKSQCFGMFQVHGAGCGRWRETIKNTSVRTCELHQLPPHRFASIPQPQAISLSPLPDLRATSCSITNWVVNLQALGGLQVVKFIQVHKNGTFWKFQPPCYYWVLVLL